MENKRKKNKKGRRPPLLFLSLALIIIVVIILAVIKLLPKKEEKNYYKIQNRTDQVVSTSIEDDGVTYPAVGWLQIQGTDIDYPIVFNEEANEYPATSDHYVWLSNLEVKFQKHIVLSGHNIFNLSNHPKIKDPLFTRFEELMAFIYYDFAKGNKYIQLTMDGQEYVYKIFSVNLIPFDDTLFFPREYGYTEKEIYSYAKELKETSLFDYNVKIDKNDNILSLVTCTRFYGQDDRYEFRVLGRLVREGEKLDNYSVKKSNNYQKVENILKGDDNNEENNA